MISRYENLTMLFEVRMIYLSNSSFHTMIRINNIYSIKVNAKKYQNQLYLNRIASCVRFSGTMIFKLRNIIWPEAITFLFT